MYNNQTYLFTPAQKDANQLKAEFVVRKDVFEQIYSDIKEDKMEHPPQHFMILGQRGMGKTTLLLRLKYAIEEDESLNTWLLPVIFNEEQYAMSDLASFFEHIAELIADKNPVYQSLLAQMRVHEFEDVYDQKSFDVLANALKANNQKIAVFHDNFGDFLNKIGKNAIHRLRNILMNSPLIRLVGASATMLEHTYNYKEPLFDFFYQIRLNGLTIEETVTLFEKLAEKDENYKDFHEKIKTGKSRIEVIRKLSGGVIRTMVMLFDVFMDNGRQDSFKDLEAILDRVTPLYKHRMDDLKPQQQIIVDAVARAWDAVAVSEISELCRAERQGLKTNQISAQLKQLVDNQIIEIETRTTGRTHLYRLQERFFNIWYLMRYSTRKDKQRVIWLVRFLEGWCDLNDYKALFKNYQNNLLNGKYEYSTIIDRTSAYMEVEGKDFELIAEKLNVFLSTFEYIKDRRDFDEQTIMPLLPKFMELREEFLIQLYQSYRLATISKFVKVGTELKFSKNQGIQELLILLSDENSKYRDSKEPEISEIRKYIYLFIRDYLLLSLIIGEDIDGNTSVFIEFLKGSDLKYVKEGKRTIEYYLFLILIARKQYHSLLRIFNHSEISGLSEVYRPFYFLLMEILKDEYPNEYLRAGDEYVGIIKELKDSVSYFRKLLGVEND